LACADRLVAPMMSAAALISIAALRMSPTP
jgi:hypothetical protein